MNYVVIGAIICLSAILIAVMVWTMTKQQTSTSAASTGGKKTVKRLYTFLAGIALNAGLIFVATLIVTNFTGGFTIRGIIASVLMALAIFMAFGWNGIREIKPVHVGVPMILGDLSDLFLLPGGYFWILPEPFMGFVEVSRQQMTLDPKIKRVLSADNMEAEVDVQIQYIICEPYKFQKTAEPEKALSALAERNIRWLANMIVLSKLPGVKGLFSELLEGNASLEKIKNHTSTNTVWVESEAISELGVKDAAKEWGLEIKKAMVTDIRIPQNVVDANAKREVEVAHRKSEGIQNRTLLDLMKEFKTDFPDLSDEKIADLIQVERKKATRVIIDGNAGDFTKGFVANTQIGGDKK
ncbi:MAG: SPFH domain-containing protein [Desulfobulbaceae bacterium]